MNTNFMEGRKLEQRFSNMTKKTLETDESYQKYTQDKNSTMKMSTILKSLNATGPRKKPKNNKRYFDMLSQQKDSKNNTLEH